MKKYIEIKKFLYYFEFIVEREENFFNLADYQIYTSEERQELINSDTYLRDDFLPIPQIDRDVIVRKYIDQFNRHSRLERLNGDDFFHKFHWFIEDNRLTEDWSKFEEKELLLFAVAWCEHNQIKYTAK